MPVPIGRLLGVDSKGILYIGCSKNGPGIVRRTGRNIEKHVTNADCSSVRNYMARNGYRIEVEVSRRFIREDGDNVTPALECRQLKQYKRKYGEFPPFNANGGNGRSL
jgi:hypothetical protein